MKLTKTLSAIALALLSYNALASDDKHEEGEKLYQAQCAACHGATGGMDMSKRLAPPIAGVRMHYISAHPDKDAFVTAVSGWLASQEESKSLMPGAIRQFKLMPPLEIALEDAEKIAAYIYAGDIDKPEGFDKHVEQMHGKKGMGKGMQRMGKYGKGKGMACQGMQGMGKGMSGKGMNCKGMHGMHGKGMPDMGNMAGKSMPGMGQGMHRRGMPGMMMPGMKQGMMPGMGAMPRGPGMSPAEMSAKLMQQFDLSADQMAKMQALMKKKSATMQSLRQQKQALNKKFDALDTGSASYKSDIFSLAAEQATLARRMTIEKGEMRFNLDSLLSPEQRQRFAQMRARKSEMKQRMGMRKGMPRGMGMPPMPNMGKPPMSMPTMKMPAPATPAPAAPAVSGPAPTAPTRAAPPKSE